MTDPVASIAIPSTATTERHGDEAKGFASSQTATAPAPEPKPKVVDEPLRLVVEPSGAAGGYTYKLYDRVTGLLMIELPRDDAEKMSASPGYSAGQVYSAKA